MVIRLRKEGSYKNIERFFKFVDQQGFKENLHTIGRAGVNALAANTPVDTGKTAQSWTYQIELTNRGWGISWSNTNVVKGVAVAILIQYGHATGTGGYVPGVDYINPAIEPIFGKASHDFWEGVKNA